MKLTFVPKLLPICLSAILAVPTFGQTAADTPPVDLGQVLQALKQIREQQEQNLKQRRTQVYQTVSSAAQSGERAVALWKDAVKAVQFEGADREGAQVREWKEKEGEALGSRECQSAARLHLQWMALSLQHASGVKRKDLLPQVIEHAKQLQLDDLMMDALTEQMDKEKERDPAKHGGKRNAAGPDDATIKRVHDQILKSQVTGSVVGRYLQVNDLLGAAKKGGDLSDWELSGGNLDAIFESVVLPEFRAAKDPRLIDYWDMVLKRESDQAAKKKLDFDERRWTQVKRPTILWQRAQDVLLLGQKNRAVSEMFTLIKTYPNHPDAASWLSRLEELLLPPAAPTGTTAVPPTTPATATPGTPPPPTAPGPAGVPPAGTRPLAR